MKPSFVFPAAARKQDKRIVEEFDSVRDIWWGKVNIKLEEARIPLREVNFALCPVIAECLAGGARLVIGPFPWNGYGPCAASCLGRVRDQP